MVLVEEPCSAAGATLNLFPDNTLDAKFNERFGVKIKTKHSSRFSARSDAALVFMLMYSY